MSTPRISTATCDAISHGSLMGARGNSGVILSQILRGFVSTVKDHGTTDVDGDAPWREVRRRRCRLRPPAPTRPC